MNGRCYIPTFGILLTCMKSQKARFTGSYCKVNCCYSERYSRCTHPTSRGWTSGINNSQSKDSARWLVLSLSPPSSGHFVYYLIAFSMPSLNSVFPFLEAICPLDDPTWHIRRGRQLDCFESAWLFCQRSLDTPDSVTLVSISHRLLTDAEHLTEARGCFLLCLIPRKWGVEGVHDQLLRVCTLLMLHSGSGHIISQVNFYKYK